MTSEMKQKTVVASTIDEIKKICDEYFIFLIEELSTKGKTKYLIPIFVPFSIIFLKKSKVNLLFFLILILLICLRNMFLMILSAII